MHSRSPQLGRCRRPRYFHPAGYLTELPAVPLLEAEICDLRLKFCELLFRVFCIRRRRIEFQHKLQLLPSRRCLTCLQTRHSETIMDSCSLGYLSFALEIDSFS